MAKNIQKIITYINLLNGENMQENLLTEAQEKALYAQECAVVNNIFKLRDIFIKNLKSKIVNLETILRHKNDPEVSKQLEIETNKLKKDSSLVGLVLSLMKIQNSWIINKMYCDEETRYNKEWYTDYFSKTTFYKRKRDAIKEFIEIYFNYV
ncbi:MG284/MPN403 family protein [Mycoplasma sp. 1232]|uniref:MG284/MPN403 family protein n=1 Tax=Mycoplasma sp. 1232 TaxID=3108527 RepID=UPI002B25D794|nr:hypothetical protein [Mycoplasma sp. 1232]MEA4333871.1 hypothetical protein [Mycoplasma sp. 1232]